MDKEKFAQLAEIANEYLEVNDKRVANALSEMLSMMAEANSNLTLNEQRTLRSYCEKTAGMDTREMFEEATLAMFNTAQLWRGAELCEEAKKQDWIDDIRYREQKAEFLAGLNRTSEAEELLLPLVEQRPDDVWHYIRLGDIYSLHQVLDDRKNYRKAEEWYYRAYDRGLCNSKNKDHRELLLRLGETCVERLRTAAQNDAYKMFINMQIGGWRTMQDFMRTVYLVGSDSVVFHVLQMEIMEQGRADHKEASRRLDILMNAYNFLPQRALDGRCPFEMAEYLYDGESGRIQREMFEAAEQEVAKGKLLRIEEGALGAVAFSEFQVKFYAEIDQKTGKVRQAIMNEEHKKKKRAIAKGNFLWLGFTKYRNIEKYSRPAAQ